MGTSSYWPAKVATSYHEITVDDCGDGEEQIPAVVIVGQERKSGYL